MERRRLLATYAISAVILLNSCSESGDDPDPCLNGPEIEIDRTIASIAGKTTGEISASASEGSGTYQFSIDGTNFQTDGKFANLSGGQYIVTVEDGNGCTEEQMQTIAEIPEVFYVNQIRPIIDTNCQVSNCHGSNGNIPTFATYNDVKSKAGAIKFKTGNGSMPPNGPLSDGDVKLIADWVDIGTPEN
jgi:hypothetical protein